MRGAGCTINDMWDKDIDKKVSCAVAVWAHTGSWMILGTCQVFLSCMLP